ncbi:Ferredoxin-like protein [Gloeothece citriformis PCC 7424]|uniref:Ferredoxin n=1 Tax=Gloeothece citriformis (strain PCC 7424) TaxID=65393 RepID=B7KH86_GLOC7|nr:ferredoxin [Gloeothece citriformis]ACK69295.1 Ferredoxin-like protein [Gloeothece citriformis PCC 7424]
MDGVSPTPDRTGLEPELGGVFREQPERTGFEPELGGQLRQKGAYVDEVTCIGCKHCAHVAPNTFYIEPEYGRSRVFNQDGDSQESIQEAIETCPVDCIHWVNYSELKELEEARKYQVIKQLGFPQIHHDLVGDRKRKRKARPQNQPLREKSNQNNQ